MKRRRAKLHVKGASKGWKRNLNPTFEGRDDADLWLKFARVNEDLTQLERVFEGLEFDSDAAVSAPSVEPTPVAVAAVVKSSEPVEPAEPAEPDDPDVENKKTLLDPFG